MLHCPIIPDKRIAFVAIPKNAGTSIRHAFGVAQGFLDQNRTLKRLYAKPWPSVATKAEIRDLKEQGYFRFCVARNPWIRIASCWQEKNRKPEWLAQQNSVFDKEMDFLQFTRKVFMIPDELSDRHFRSQHTFIFDGDVSLVDSILRFETLEEGWKVLEQDYGLPALRRLKFTGADESYKEIYDTYPEAQALVAKRYARDIEFFGYTF